jgi:HEPN domain-containing protein
LESSPSGRFLLRLDPALHARLRADAEALGLSLNEYCSRVLAAPGSGGVLPAGEVVQRAGVRFGDRLKGVIVYGSWARDRLADTSDIDLLLVLSPDVPISRSLYRQWDDEPLVWEGREVEVHFAHLPSVDEPVSGLWAEMALDGIVLYDPGLEVTRLLGGIRRRVAAGEVRRRVLHGEGDYVRRAQVRLKTLDLLFDEESWADVVRESQEAVELALKGLLRSRGIDPPRVHDVSEVLLAERPRLPEPLQDEADRLAEASRQVRRDRELAFYGAEDLTPSGFYTREDAAEARALARTTVELIVPHVLGKE